LRFDQSRRCNLKLELALAPSCAPQSPELDDEPEPVNKNETLALRV